MTEFKPLYISVIKNICNSDVINSERDRDGKKPKIETSIKS